MKNFLPFVLCCAAVFALPGPRAMGQDLAAYAGYPAGQFESEAVSPPGAGWFPLTGEGPGNGDCLSSAYLWNAGEESILSLTLAGPGLLTFSWQVSSLENDGWLICRLGMTGSAMEAGRISGVGGGWQTRQVFIPQGEHTVSWHYQKTTYLSDGEDAGRLAAVQYTAYPASRQTFEQYKAAHGVTGEGRTQVSGRRLDTSWLMGLAPGAPLPPELGFTGVQNGEASYRIRVSLAADSLLGTSASPDLLAWAPQASRFEILPASLTAGTVDMNLYFPAGDRLFFRHEHPPVVTPPLPSLAYIPPGHFLAGSPVTETGRVWTGYVSGSHAGEEDYRHEVTLTRGFFLNKYEVTWGEWLDVQAWGNANGYAIGDGDEARGGRFLLQADGGNILNAADSEDTSDLQPATNIGFYDALKWLNARSEREGLQPCYSIRLKPSLGGATLVWRSTPASDIGNDPDDIRCDWDADGWRLPTEAEWEFACRAGTFTALSNGKNLTNPKHYPKWPVDPAESGLDDPALDGIASYFGNGGATTRVGSRRPNGFGLYDMHGNVHEWCWDRYNTLVPNQFNGEPLVDPKGPQGGIYRVIRGGSYRMPPHMLRSAGRLSAPSGGGNSREAGFRVARNAPE